MIMLDVSSDIQKLVGITQAGLTKLLKRLVEKRYVLRELKDDCYPPCVYYRINPEKEDEVKRLFVEKVRFYFDVLMDFNPEECKKLLKELKSISKKRFKDV